MSDTAITIEVAGQPQGKGRARAVVRKDKTGRVYAGTYTPDKTRSYEGMIRFAAQEAMKGRNPIDGPVRFQLTATFDVPASYSRAKRSDALGNRLQPTKKPDIDNIVKAFCDALNGVVFKDDVQIVRGEYAKIYGEKPSVVATVSPL